MYRLEVVYGRFFQFWLIFPYKNYQSHSKEYNFNWCLHHARHLKKKRFPIFENLLKALRITTKVLSCLALQIVRTSSQPPDPVNSFLPSHPLDRCLNLPWRNSSSASVEEFYYSFYYCEGLENKLTRAPLLGLAKSTYWPISELPLASFSKRVLVLMDGEIVICFEVSNLLRGRSLCYFCDLWSGG